MLHCSPFILTFYPAAYPSETNPFVLQSASHYIDGETSLDGLAEQIIQRADYIRGAVPDFFPRGNRATTLTWEEVRFADTHAAAIAAGLEAITAMPDTTGWLHISLPALGRAWALTPCAIRSGGYRHQPRGSGRRDLLRLRWQLDSGALTELHITAEPDTLQLETGYEFQLEDAGYLELETAA